MRDGDEREDGELPEGWRWDTIGGVAEVSGGLTKNAAKRDASKVRAPLVSVAAVHLRQIDKESIGEVGLLDGDADRATLAKGDLLVVEGNGSLEHIGRVALWNDEVPGARHQNHIIRVRPRELASRYLLEWLASPLGRDAIVEEATSAAGLYTLSLSKVERLPIPVPPLPEQRRIVAKLESLQARSRRAREALEAVPPLLEKLRQSILAAAFRGDLTADWRAQHPDVEPASELLKRIRIERRKKWEEAELAKLKAKGKTPTDDKWKQKYVEPEPVDDSELPELPEGWAWTTWGALSEWITYGFTRPMPHVEEGVPIVTARHVANSQIDLYTGDKTTEEAFAALSAKDIPEPGDILVTKDGTIGRAAIVPNDARFCINQSVTVLWLRCCPANREYLLAAIESPTTQKRFLAAAAGTAVQHLSVTDFARMPLPMPPLVEQSVIAERVRIWRMRLAVLARSAQIQPEQLAQLDSAILSKAFRGELVPQDPNDAISPVPDATTTQSVPAPAQTTRAGKGTRRAHR